MSKSITEYDTLKQQQTFRTKAVSLLEDNFAKSHIRKECEYFFTDADIDYLEKYGRKELTKLNHVIENIEDIYNKVDSGYTLTEIALEKKVSKQAISKQFNRIYPKGYVHFVENKKLAKIREHRKMELYFSLEEYAEYFSTDITTMRRLSKKYNLGLLTKYNLLQEEKVTYYTPLVLNLLNENVSKQEIETTLNISRELIDKIVREQNIKPKRLSSEEAAKRNKQIHLDSEHLSVKELAVKYELTPKYINEILRKKLIA